MPGTLRTARPRAQLRQGRTDWYRISNSVGSGPAVIYIYDEIGGWWGVTASDFIRDLAAINASEIELHLNSPGGDVFDGIAISNAIRQHRAQVTVHVDALAASIASVIAMGGDRVVMAPGSQMMIHDGLTLCIGNAADMRATADFLDQQSDNIASIYAARAGGTVEEWRARMTAETWYTAQEAVAAGLADEVSSTHSITEANPVENLSWDLSVFNYAGRSEAPDPLASQPNEAPTPPVAADPIAAVVDDASVEPGTAVLVAPEQQAPASEPEPDPWTELVAAYSAAPADPWAELTSHFTNPNPSPERGDQS